MTQARTPAMVRRLVSLMVFTCLMSHYPVQEQYALDNCGKDGADIPTMLEDGHLYHGAGMALSQISIFARK
jgi:hypothetical protein